MGIYYAFEDHNLIGVFSDKKTLKKSILDYIYKYFIFLNIFDKKKSLEDNLLTIQDELNILEKEFSSVIKDHNFNINYVNNIDFSGKLNDIYDPTKVFETDKKPDKPTMKSPAVFVTDKNNKETKTVKKNKEETFSGIMNIIHDDDYDSDDEKDEDQIKRKWLYLTPGQIEEEFNTKIEYLQV